MWTRVKTGNEDGGREITCLDISVRKINWTWSEGDDSVCSVTLNLKTQEFRRKLGALW